jgi:hypothetical protein
LLAVLSEVRPVGPLKNSKNPRKFVAGFFGRLESRQPREDPLAKFAGPVIEALH